MCTYVNKDDNWKMAEKDIICYKVMLKKTIDGEACVESIYQGKEYLHIGRKIYAADPTYHIKHSRFLDKEAVHAYISKSIAKKRGKDILYSTFDPGPILSIVRCIIPKGTYFIKGSNYFCLNSISNIDELDTICSKELIIDKIYK